MLQYLSYEFNDTDAFIDTFDEAPLWSAAFGLLLLKHVSVKRNITVIDIGSGTGFPLMELAGRLGSSCRLYGIDPWAQANKRARQKMENYGLANVNIIECCATEMPFEKNTVDLIVSNLGINNFKEPAAVFATCNSVLKPAGKLVLTTNVIGHWKEFYQIFYMTLQQRNKQRLIPLLKEEEEHRGSVESLTQLFTDNNFRITRQFKESMEMRFADGSAFLNHPFVKLGWLTTWLHLFPEQELQEIFFALETNLNTYAAVNNGLALTVPMVFMEGEKIDDI